MLVLMEKDAAHSHAVAVAAKVAELGFVAHPVRHAGRVALAVVAPVTDVDPAAPGRRIDAVAHLQAALEGLTGVDEARQVRAPHVLVGREAQTESSCLEVDGQVVGGNEVVVMAGPCAVESEAQIFACAAAARASGATFLRGGAFKPRTSPYDFQGLGEAGLVLLAAAARAHGLRVVTEVVDPADVQLVGRYAQVLQVGARNMQNFALLKAVGAQPRAVLLKRGMCATYREWLMAAEYVAAHGNPNILLCERGIRSFDASTRNVFDVAAVPVLKTMTHLPVLIDPSHATGRRDVVAAVARAGVAAGADGILVEMHPNPDEALSDGAQSLDFAGFAALTRELARVAAAIDRSLACGASHAQSRP